VKQLKTPVLKYYLLVGLWLAAMAILPSCQVRKCPAATGGYVDPPPKVNKYTYRAKLSNWPKGMKPYK